MASLPIRSKPKPRPKPESTPEDVPSKYKSSIETLPTELLLQIFADVDHEDTQNFARCCPLIWKAAEKVFAVHKRRRKYHTVRLGHLSHSQGPTTSLFDILWDLVKDEGLVIYPKRMIIGALPMWVALQEEVDPQGPFDSLRARR